VRNWLQTLLSKWVNLYSYVKDLDLMDSGRKVETKLAAHVKRAVEKDVKFLEANRLIDYSMMLGLHHRKEGEEGGEGGGLEGLEGFGDKEDVSVHRRQGSYGGPTVGLYKLTPVEPYSLKGNRLASTLGPIK
jgi:hypothetical protein